ncbi:DUF3943 domain-containing protein [Ferrimonas sediminicola]|uniref:DUF3943 domain-containing protein n=1 Tax=Ferrimonas sediminicola TaxID=2569538 RepID=A0A4U1BE24_9GAMM|nr:DUF3943 domain-containing protein [Ferrimonas sediminicola]TKB49048.1 DUF3943 domain-containing protein [Ferrimonas sediminicola]
MRLCGVALALALLLSAGAVAQEEVARAPITNSRWEELSVDKGGDEDPFAVSLFSAPHGEDKTRLWSQTKSVMAYGVGVAGVIALMPEDLSNWETSDDLLLSKWWDNVSEGPVWDRDAWHINYIGHPYFGGVYYQVARKSGYRQWDAFLYSLLMSTFYWEYGLEAFAEVPSIQDLVVTPVLGWVYGEWAFHKEQQIWARGGRVWGSGTLGSTALFFLDPVDGIGRGINNLMGRQVVKAGTGYMTLNEVPMSNGDSDTQLQLHLRYSFGGGEGARRPPRTGQIPSDDPIDTGLVGLSIGTSWVAPDSNWGVEGGAATVMTLGLYFTPAFSTRLSYIRGDLDEKGSGKLLTYENYSLDAQYYWLGEGDLRPFITGGIGETLRDQDRDRKTFQVNGGAGLHWRWHRNWALQGQWRAFHSTRFSTTDTLAEIQLIYRFGGGER